MANSDIFAAMAPILSLCRDLDFSDPDACEQRIEQAFPFESAELQALRRLCERGVEEGWLCDRGAAGVRYSRVAKPDGAGQTMSLDAVLLHGPGPGHRHPRGELDLCFPHEGDPTFDGRPPGWIAYDAGSQHVPTVAGGTMLILYILPDAAIEWL